MTQDKIKEILDMLNTLNEYFLSLPDDMLLNVDPRDNESLEKGFCFIKEFNDSLSEFIISSNKIELQIKNYFAINPEDDDLEKESVQDKKEKQIIKEFNDATLHTLDENFTYQRPYGFVLRGSAYKGLKTWKSFYMQVLRELKEYNSDQFFQLPEETQFVSKRGRPFFARSSDELRIAERLDTDFYIEVNLSANAIRNIIIDLLEHFAIDSKEMKIYLREDNSL
jgi:hypothetical protein